MIEQLRKFSRQSVESIRNKLGLNFVTGEIQQMIKVTPNQWIIQVQGEPFLVGDGKVKRLDLCRGKVVRVKGLLRWLGESPFKVEDRDGSDG